MLFLMSSLLSFGQMTSHSYKYDSIKREFNVYVPKSYDASKDKLPVVFFFHGMGGNMNNFSGFTYKAEAEKFIMVIPQGVFDKTSNATNWHSGAGIDGKYPNANIDDVGFVNSLIDTVSKWYKVDATRIYSTGFSMGAFMSNRIACELGDRFAAIASISGTMGNEIINTCNPAGPIPVLHIHSTNDAVVPFSNNRYGYDALELMNFWVKYNSCNEVADTTDLSHIENDGFSVQKYLFKNGKQNSEVEFYKLIGPDHSGSWYTKQSGNDFDAIDVTWNFFSRHSNKSPTNSNQKPFITNIKNAKLDVFPNPASDKITLSFSGNVSLSSIIISNTLGKTLETKYFDKPIKQSVFDISDKAPGIYFFQIKDNEGNLSVLRFYKK